MGIRPSLLTKNSTIGICSPSHVADRNEYAHTIDCIKNFGFKVKEADNLYKNTYVYLASEQERAADFNQLIADDEVDMILFGGGEGSNELLPYLDYELIKQHPKFICSFSDGTTILDSIYAMTGVETYYGQAPYLFDDFSDYDKNQFIQHFEDDKNNVYIPNSEWKVQIVGKAKGILIGGYARNFAMLLGSRYFPLNLNEKYILFIEDHEMFGGVDYVSAMLSHIEQTDFINSVTGLIFGHYSENSHPELLDRLKRIGEKYNIPVVYCDDFGHGKNHSIFPIGRKATLDTAVPTLIFE